MKVPISIASVCLAWALPAAFAQISMTSGSLRTGPDGRYTASYTINAATFSAAFLQGRPYSAEEISQQTQTLQDGTRTVRSTPSNFVYRDSAGRTRTEKRFPVPPIGTQAEIPGVPEISDPVTGYSYYLDTTNRIAHRIALPKPVRFMPSQAMTFSGSPMVFSSSPMAKDVVTSSEPLGTQILEGIQAQGHRTIMTYPIGSMGNDRPVVTTMENWISPEFNITILSKTSDPRSGESVRALVNISLAEPDPSLFQIPPGYKIVDETGPFTITITGPSNTVPAN